MIRDPNLERGRRSSGSSEAVPLHDWRLPGQEPNATSKWPQLHVFDSYIRERLEDILVRREAERAHERSLSRIARAKRWRAQLKRRRREFADALELSLCPPFSLDAISRPHPGRQGQALYSNADLEAGFNVVTATWLRDGRGAPAMVVTQPHFLDYALAVQVGEVEGVKLVRHINIIEAPSELGWVGSERSLVMWSPAP